eukprot:TRINITY_DN4169_c0_g1_i14.p1 TRINITY_DN4169_c0_g1~~TRINITY_DN4169_c0_g1_i14.p1  ORF type:complete len:390 (+),score=72.90 TRINITY_DN4169_c0_g1_i14:1655-2824(+)
MGTKMGPSFACLFVGYIEEKAISQYSGPIPSFYRRFIDDCLGATTGPKDALINFINHMSNFHPALKYTSDVSSSSVAFLDLQISVQPNSNQLSTSVFYKSTDSHSYLLYNSNHPPATRNSIPYSQFLRLRRICSNESDFREQVEKMADFFLTRQYPSDIVSKALERASAVTRTEALTPSTSNNNEDRTVMVLTYHPHNLPVRNILLKNFHLLQEDPLLKSVFPKPPLVAFKRDTNIKDHLVKAAVHNHPPSTRPPGTSPCNCKGCKTCAFIDDSTKFTGPTGHFKIKSNFTCQSSDVVYILSCTLCNKLYIGESYRSIDERFAEHLRSVRLHYDNPVGHHFNGPMHSWSHVKVAALWKNSSSWMYRKHMESLLISKLGTTTPGGLNTKE